MSTPTKGLLQLVASAARFAQPGTSWDPKVHALDQVVAVVTDEEHRRRYPPSRQLPTEGSVMERLEHLQNITPVRLETLRLEIPEPSPSFEQEHIKRSLTNLWTYNKTRVHIPAFSFNIESNDSDVILVGVWIAAHMCWNLGYAFPSLERHSLHSIIDAIVDIVRPGTGHIYCPAPAHRGRVGLLHQTVGRSSRSPPTPQGWPYPPSPPPPPPPLHPRPSPASSRSASPVNGHAAPLVSATSRCSSPAPSQVANAARPGLAVNEEDQEAERGWEVLV